MQRRLLKLHIALTDKYNAAIANEKTRHMGDFWRDRIDIVKNYIEDDADGTPGCDWAYRLVVIAEFEKLVE